MVRSSAFARLRFWKKEKKSAFPREDGEVNRDGKGGGQRICSESGAQKIYVGLRLFPDAITRTDRKWLENVFAIFGESRVPQPALRDELVRPGEVGR